MSIICITSLIFVDVGNDDPQDVTNSFILGLDNALRPFPHDVVDTDVESMRILDEAEISERGFEES